MILVIPWQKFSCRTFQQKEHWGSGWWDFTTNLGLEDGNSPLSLAFASIHAKHEGPPRRWVKPNQHGWREQSSLFTASHSSHSIFAFYHMLSLLSPRHLATLQSPKTSPKVPFSLQAVQATFAPRLSLFLGCVAGLLCLLRLLCGLEGLFRCSD